MNANKIASTKLLTGTDAPTLEVSTLDGQTWRLAEQNPPNYTAVVFYRGWHCPFCQAQLIEFERKLAELTALGIEAIAISGDTEERARQSKQDWNLDHIRLGYGLKLGDMRRWGLYISRGAYENEPARFNEPAIFLVKPDGILAIAMIGSIPFARPRVEDLINGLDYILKNNYPIRGTEI